MKVVILAGGFGTRLSEETEIKPKPMVDIGYKPILWHIMKLYSAYGINEFIICLGYKGYLIKEYFSHYYIHETDFTIDLKDNSIEYHNTNPDSWKVTLSDTGLNTATGGRLKRVRKYIGDETFMMTYGDGVGDVNIADLLEFHRLYKKPATITAVQPAGRFGAVDIDGSNRVASFMEKPRGDNTWVNAGFFVLEPNVFDYIESDDTIWERDPLVNLARDNNLVAYKHLGFWKPMDTMRDKQELNSLWDSGHAPWKKW
jgi:glucose-1-phosphate cytidylyltransferase